MNISTLLSRLNDLEHAMADLHLWLSGVFEDDPEASRLFARLHVQELSRASLSMPASPPVSPGSAGRVTRTRRTDRP